MLRHTPLPRSRYFTAEQFFFLTRGKKNFWAKGACTPKNVNFKSMGGADVRWRLRLNARRGSGKEGAPICGGGGDRNAATRPALPRLPGRTSGAALAPTRRLCRLRGLVRARKPARDPPSSALPLPRRRPSAPPPPHRSFPSARGLPSWARSASPVHTWYRPPRSLRRETCWGDAGTGT